MGDRGALEDAAYGWIRSTEARVVGINGPQGCGKSTLCMKLVNRAAGDGLFWVTLSTDDCYLTRVEQEAVARRFPDDSLLAVRGAPGTHDVDLGARILDALAGSRGRVEIPRYDKSACGGLGDRRPVDAWSTVELPVDLVLFEGWTLGFEPQHVGGPLTHVDHLLQAYIRWNKRLDALLQIRTADERSIVRWRVEAERNRRGLGQSGMSDADALAYVERFLVLYRVYPNALALRPPSRSFRVMWLDEARALVQEGDLWPRTQP